MSAEGATVPISSPQMRRSPSKKNREGGKHPPLPLAEAVQQLVVRKIDVVGVPLHLL